MTKRVVLVSGCVRGKLHSQLRRDDMRSIRTALERLRHDKAHKDAVLIAPYLLYAEVTEDVLGARERGEAGYSLIPYTEVLLLGSELHPDMRAEALCAMKSGLPVEAETLVMQGRIANLRFKHAVQKILQPAA